MSWNPFINRIYDEDLCFAQNIIAVTAAIAEVTSIEATRAIVMSYVDQMGLRPLLERYDNLGSRDEVQDCFPRNRDKLMSNAEFLCNLYKRFKSHGFTQNEEVHVLRPVREAIRKMGFYYEEKKYLITKYFLGEDAEDMHPEVLEYLVSQWMDLL